MVPIGDPLRDHPVWVMFALTAPGTMARVLRGVRPRPTER